MGKYSYNLLVIVFCIIVSSVFIQANIVISPTPANITCRVGVSSSNQIDIFNNYSFAIMDFAFSNLANEGFSFQNIEIPANSTRTLNLTILSNSSQHKTISSIVSFKYAVEIPEETITHYINITGTGFSPNYLIIRQGDTVIWNNIDDIDHTITWSENHDVLVNGTFSYTFNNIETILYQDIEWDEYQFFSGTIDVLNKTTSQKAHNPNYDYAWAINLNSNLNPTTLQVNLIDNYFEVESNKNTEGMVKVKNNGSEIADVITMSADSPWIHFNTNNFNLATNENKYVPFIISPTIFSTNQTNKTYEISIKAKATNTEEYSNTINIFVPYKYIDMSNPTSPEEFLNSITIWCKLNPNNFFCNNSLSGNGNGSVIIQEKNYGFNMTQTDFYELKKELLKALRSDQLSDNQEKILADELHITIPELRGLLNQSLQMQLNNEQKTKTNWDVVWIIGFFILIIGCGLIVFFEVKKYFYKKYLRDGAYEYKT